MRRRIGLVVLLLVLLGGWSFHRYGKNTWGPVALRMTGQRTVGQALREFGPPAEGRMRPRFESAGVAYPPAEIALLGFKDEKRLELWARASADGPWLHVWDYVVLGASGAAGPKLREGDLQVPEGLYRIEGMNPNSAFHLSMKVNYPNAFDLAKAEEEGRSEPGSDIFIHGKQASIGCLAVGDEAIEELFVLVSRVGLDHVRVILAPRDLRDGTPPNVEGLPPWTEALYKEIGEALTSFPLKGKTTDGM